RRHARRAGGVECRKGPELTAKTAKKYIRIGIRRKGAAFRVGGGEKNGFCPMLVCYYVLDLFLAVLAVQ
ncbi:MAG TPA: hypothetical protein VFO57_11440, partial [Burkholderiales bacterium]|nr:hypothetical protein [Burkholderiales bacterium]